MDILTAPTFKAFSPLFFYVVCVLGLRWLVGWCAGWEEGWDEEEELAGVGEAMKESRRITAEMSHVLSTCGALGHVSGKYLEKRRSLGRQLDQHPHKFSLSWVRLEMRGKGSIVQWFSGIGSRPVASTTWELVRHANSQVPPQAYLI